MKNLYVGNLPHSTTETELRTLFQAHGDIDVSPQDELQELREHAEAQAAMFRVGLAAAEVSTAGSTENNGTDQ